MNSFDSMMLKNALPPKALQTFSFLQKLFGYQRHHFAGLLEHAESGRLMGRGEESRQTLDEYTSGCVDVFKMVADELAKPFTSSIHLKAFFPTEYFRPDLKPAIPDMTAGDYEKKELTPLIRELEKLSNVYAGYCRAADKQFRPR